MTAISIPTPLREILRRLEYLAMIERGSKPCVNNMTFVDQHSWLGAITRSVNHENAQHTLLSIDNTIEETIKAINEYKASQFIRLIIDALRRARNGIANLSGTYAGRHDILASLNVTLSNIDIQLEKNVDETLEE
jgi:hypothetical protein